MRHRPLLRELHGWLLALLLVLTSFATPVRAAGPGPTPTPVPVNQKARADALFATGKRLLLRAGEYKRALAPLGEARELYHSLGDTELEADTLTGIGLAHFSLGQQEQALAAQQEALDLARRVGSRRVEEDALINTGQVYASQGRALEQLSDYERDLVTRQQAGDRAGAALFLTLIAAMYSAMKLYDDALDSNLKALEIRQQINDLAGQVRTLHQVGSTYGRLKKYSRALDAYNQALLVEQEAADQIGQAATLYLVGATYSDMGQYRRALDAYNQALTIAHSAGDQDQEQEMLHDTGKIYYRLGQYERALDAYNQALTIARDLGDQVGEGIVLIEIGRSYTLLRNYERALDAYNQALTIARNNNYQLAEADVYVRFGEIYDKLLQPDLALNNLHQALSIYSDLRDPQGEGNAHRVMGEIYGEQRRTDQALEHLEAARAIFQQTGDWLQEGITLNSIGQIYYALDQPEEAVKYYEQALVADPTNLSSRTSNIAQAFNNIGLAYLKMKKFEQALVFFQRTLELRDVIASEPATEGATLHNIGLAYEANGNRDQAIEFYQQAVALFESIQGNIKVDELKVSFAGGHADTYERLINLLWDAGRYQDAFTYSEMARARAFLDQLANRPVNPRAGAATDLLARERALQANIQTLRAELEAMRERPADQQDIGAITRGQNDLNAREKDYATLLIELKRQNPEVAALVSVSVASLEEIQRLLDGDTTLVEYVVTEQRTLAYVITHTGFETATLQVSREDLSKTIAGMLHFASLDDPHPASLRQLYAWLIAPLKPSIKTRLLGLVSNGVLHYLPFGALTDGANYLSDSYVLFTLPDASMLRFLPSKRKPNADTALVVGNPAVGEPLPALRFAEQEASTIAGLYGTQPLLGTAATESTVRAQVTHASILHLAAHGTYNRLNPLFSTLYLARDSQQDGRLEVYEIYELDLTAATDLVVLSACQTEIGQLSGGDEVIGLSRAFLHAGTPTVIASLWSVDDQATSKLMEMFYTYLKQGKSKAEALQAAQIAVRAQFPHPYFWAAFVLTGDPGIGHPAARALPVEMRPAIWLAIGAASVCIAGLAFWLKRRRCRSPRN